MVSLPKNYQPYAERGRVFNFAKYGFGAYNSRSSFILLITSPPTARAARVKNNIARNRLEIIDINFNLLLQFSEYFENIANKVLIIFVQFFNFNKKWIENAHFSTYAYRKSG